jgi:hypothetical protein
MIYPGKRKKIIKAASGLNTEQIDPNAEKNDKVDQMGTGIVSKINPLWGALAQVGITGSKKLRGDGSTDKKNISAQFADPFNQFKNNRNAGDWIKSFALPGLSAVQKGKRQTKEFEKEKRRQENLATNSLNAQSNSAFGTLTFEKGGSIPGVQDQAVVLGGEMHEDGGNAVLDARTGEKVAETEREELLFTKAQTESIEKHIAAFEKTSDVSHLLALGKMIQDIVNNNMIDYSGKY